MSNILCCLPESGGEGKDVSMCLWGLYVENEDRDQPAHKDSRCSQVLGYCTSFSFVRQFQSDINICSLWKNEKNTVFNSLHAG